MSNPFAPIRGLSVYYVDSAAGSGKTYSMVAAAIDRAAKLGTKTLFAMPTLELIREFVEFARRNTSGVPIIEITSREDDKKPRKFSTTSLLFMHLRGRDMKDNPLKDYPEDGQLVFISHETLNRMVVWDMTDLESLLQSLAMECVFWPTETREWELVIDETPEVILTRQPFRLHDSGSVLTSFLEAELLTSTPMTRRARRRFEQKAHEAGVAVFDLTLLDKAESILASRQNRLATFELYIENGEAGGSVGEIEEATRQIPKVKAEIAAIKAEIADLQTAKAQSDKELNEADLPEIMRRYCQVKAKNQKWLLRRVRVVKWDAVYELLDPLPNWLLQGAVLFADWEGWQAMTSDTGYGPRRGRLTVAGIRRPDALTRFRSVTVMSALFKHTLVHDVWSQLGVDFVPSPLVKLDVPTTLLGKRRLRIAWITDQGWSKRLRDKSGGIGVIFDLIFRSGILDPAEAVCVCTNKDDGSEDDPRAVFDHLAGRTAKTVVMPHNSRGQNRFREFHQLIHTAALNAYTPDIRWLEQCLGINSATQRIGRCGQEIYQTAMRLSLREPKSSHDVTLVVMDRDVAEWLVQWFSPAEQVEVIEIDASDVVQRKKSRTGRPALGERPMTAAERKARSRQQKREQPSP